MSSRRQHRYKPAACPQCGHRPVARILYGYPRFDGQMQEDIETGRIVLGGCCVRGDDPLWECTACGWRGWRDGRSATIQSLDDDFLDEQQPHETP